jgi:murein DD-endopeptidase MepM/ murein hydrolase activator NlpD
VARSKTSAEPEAGFDCRDRAARRLRRPIAAALAAAALTLPAGLAGVAAAATGGAPTPAGSPPPPPSPTGAPAAEAPSAGILSLISARTAPHKSFYYGFRYPHLSFAIGSTQPQNDLRIDVLNAAGEVIKTFYRNDVAPDATTRVRWDGTTAAGRPARNGRYRFRILPQGEDRPARRSLLRSIRRARRRASTSSAAISLGFSLYGYAFPLLAAHSFGGPSGRFGAPRSGHTHQGQDVMAACGAPVVAARGGRVQYSGRQSAAGNYIVVDGRDSGFDMVYMHLLEPSPLKAGVTVRTGQPIGLVGRTGDATACHLHFELWTAPGWYEGGSPIDPLPFLRRWDRYS